MRKYTKRIPANVRTQNVHRLKSYFVHDACFITIQNLPLSTGSPPTHFRFRHETKQNNWLWVAVWEDVERGRKGKEVFEQSYHCFDSKLYTTTPCLVANSGIISLKTSGGACGREPYFIGCLVKDHILDQGLYIGPKICSYPYKFVFVAALLLPPPGCFEVVK